MTIRTKRRGRRSLAAIAAALLMASVLAVVAGSPAQAANTASEHMVDTNDDDKADSREFAGADRYETSLKLANRYAMQQGGLGSVTTVILASGETLIDAVTSSALSSVKQAPVLLTRSTGISRGVANFIEDNGVTNVIIVGGPAVIPDAVADEVEGLESEPTVTRLWGDNRAATAAAVASELPGGVRWCGTDDTVAILVNGSDGPAIDAIAASPLVYALELPMLLTAADELSEPAAEFLSEEDIERVVIVGGMEAVSKDVQDAVDRMDIKTQRVYNGERSGTSVELTKLVLGDGDCADEVGVDSIRVALINSEATADGVSAGPVLGRGFGDGMIPVLLVDDELPAAVRDYLASTPVENANGDKQHLSIVAIGGTAVVSNSVMAAAVAAATSSDALTAEIKAEAGTDNGVITITFNDDVGGDDFEDQIKDVIYVNGVPASIAADDSNTTPALDAITEPAQTAAAGAACGTAEQIMVTLTHPLKAGDEIEIRPSAVKFGDDSDGDRRTLQASSFTVPVPDSDTAGPNVEIIGVEGQSTLYLLASESGSADATKISINTASDVKVAVAAGAIVTPADDDNYDAETVDAELAPFGAVRYAFTLGYASDNTVDDTDDGSDNVSTSGAYTLKKGDRVILERDAVMDAVTPTANGSRAQRDGVDPRVKSFSVVPPIRLSAVDSGVDDDPATLKVPDTIANVSVAASYVIEGDGADPDTGVTIKAKWAGAASGAAGNGWSVTVDEAAGLDSTAKTPEIDVSVNKRNQVIRVRYIDGSPTKGDLVAALNADSTFADMFTASTPCAAGNAKEALSRTAVNGASLTGGRSSVAFLVTFNDYVQALVNDGADLRDDILGSLISGYAATNVAATADAIADATPYFAAVRHVAPYKQVQMLFTTQDATKIPGTRTGSGRGIVTIGGDTKNDTTDTHVATSYFADLLEADFTGDDAADKAGEFEENQNSGFKRNTSLDRNLAIK